MTRHVAFFVFPDFQLLDLSGPLAAFQVAGASSTEAYNLSVVSEHGGEVASSSGVGVTTRAACESGLDTLVVVGGRGVHASASSSTAITLLTAVAATARRIASVCTGAFLLAAAGLLDGRRATTHWRFATRLQAAYPAVQVDADRIFVKDGSVWSSAGITAGIDLALALIEEDLGAAIAKAVAREMVVYYRRPGGQSQFSALLDLTPPSARIHRALSFARDHLSEPLPVERLADAARLSLRQFGRAFVAETGQTPAKAVERLRAETARPLVEDTRESLEAIAHAAGFSDPERMRQSFIRAFGQPPQALRRAARALRVRDAAD
jgi:transcriptional regulator GlxA family with amidase domain